MKLKGKPTVGAKKLTNPLLDNRFSKGKIIGYPKGSSLNKVHIVKEGISAVNLDCMLSLNAPFSQLSAQEKKTNGTAIRIGA
ncbi:hypothetical protein M1K46_25345 [Fictibacillus sp. WQ 8-8]|uniref:hypothetical protein n=1 Tax=Fictibacillus sp. WQ 8-8 TaxID=2938788 RepID=UPI00210DCDBE|nr:hypothetical protein [Fictibacillus sp. WQ 8-8]MCQ6268880.1 hypothetical protein [Fictibacillus sp. WQ 8-8]